MKRRLGGALALVEHNARKLLKVYLKREHHVRGATSCVLIFERAESLQITEIAVVAQFYGAPRLLAVIVSAEPRIRTGAACHK